ncbi:COG4315 family predicted lipoprotein [Arthrobacter cryoconiti]|uniref:Lipoprotein n=1 Tax=Arthrobacter cryoconiti TaxID=748907 RepID=A0ABV8QZM5_9MICC|nr:hypothetical protein [Arthrobacter cryoconiti]MCC9068201.1 hypothetical protein [Arthrobacter cryoconiti]
MSQSTSPKTPSTSTATSADPTRRRRRNIYIGAAAALALAVGGVTAYFVTPRDIAVVDSGPARVAVGTVEGIGDILVDGQGRTLYLFEPDEAANVTCTGGCAKKWPPLEKNGATEPDVAKGVDASAVSTKTDQGGAEVLTFNNWPLYRYVSDEVGQVTGNGKDQNGGKWWALTPTGERVKAN